MPRQQTIVLLDVTDVTGSGEGDPVDFSGLDAVSFYMCVADAAGSGQASFFIETSADGGATWASLSLNNSFALGAPNSSVSQYAAPLGGQAPLGLVKASYACSGSTIHITGKVFALVR